MTNLQIAFAIINLGLKTINEIQISMQINPADEQAIKDKVREVQSRIKTLKGKEVT